MGKYFALTEEGVRRFATASFNASRSMTITSVNVPRWMMTRPFAYLFNDVGAGAGASAQFSEGALPILYRFMSSIKILGAP